MLWTVLSACAEKTGRNTNYSATVRWRSAYRPTIRCVRSGRWWTRRRRRSTDASTRSTARTGAVDSSGAAAARATATATDADAVFGAQRADADGATGIQPAVSAGLW